MSETKEEKPSKIVLRVPKRCTAKGCRSKIDYALFHIEGKLEFMCEVCVVVAYRED